MSAALMILAYTYYFVSLEVAKINTTLMSFLLIFSYAGSTFPGPDWSFGLSFHLLLIISLLLLEHIASKSALVQLQIHSFSSHLSPKTTHFLPLVSNISSNFPQQQFQNFVAILNVPVLSHIQSFSKDGFFSNFVDKNRGSRGTLYSPY